MKTLYRSKPPALCGKQAQNRSASRAADERGAMTETAAGAAWRVPSCAKPLYSCGAPRDIGGRPHIFCLALPVLRTAPLAPTAPAGGDGGAACCGREVGREHAHFFCGRGRTRCGYVPALPAYATPYGAGTSIERAARICGLRRAAFLLSLVCAGTLTVADGTWCGISSALCLLAPAVWRYPRGWTCYRYSPRLRLLRGVPSQHARAASSVCLLSPVTQTMLCHQASSMPFAHFSAASACCWHSTGITAARAADVLALRLSDIYLSIRSSGRRGALRQLQRRYFRAASLPSYVSVIPVVRPPWKSTLALAASSWFL